jgi:Ser/Thr protein kinase RdoA (MazF antagonist)
MAKTRPYIPEHLDELTAEFLTSALRERGFLEKARVTDVEREPLGDGEGFLGVIARLRLRYDEDEPAAPRSLIAKLPTSAKSNRVMGELMGAYRREILFYEDLAPRVPLRTPVAYYAAFDDQPKREREEKMAGALDKLPMWMVGGVMSWARFVTGRRNNRYLLLIEDLAPGRVGDQVEGGSVEECSRVLSAIAGAHAAFWNSPLLASRTWLSRQDMNPRMRHGAYLGARGAFKKRQKKLLDRGLDRHLAWLDENGVEVAIALHRDAPDTLIHCDFRFDNLVFDDHATAPGVAVFDWQLVGVGAAAYDVAYLLSGALHADEDPETEMSLLRGYHDALTGSGAVQASSYDFSTFLRDYRRALYLVLAVVASTDDMEMGNDRGIHLMDRWAERTFARLRGVDPRANL